MHTFDPAVLIAARTPLTAQPDIIHIWAFSLEGSPDCIAQCRRWLSTAEAARADRFVFQRDRDQHVIAHGVLRCLLGRYLQVAPETLAFGAGPAGKPFLEVASGADPGIRFNLTHSAGRAVLAVARDRELGVDLEAVRDNIETLSIARRFFFASERVAIESAPEEQRADTFIRFWVAKETVLKAQGVGIGFPLDRFEVRFDASGDSAHITTSWPERLSGDWVIRMLPTEPGWYAAVASAAHQWEFRLENQATPQR